MPGEEPHQQAATGPHVLRRINAVAVLNALRGKESATVSGLAAETGLSRPAVSRALAALTERGVVDQLGSDPGAMGRPAARVRFRAELGHVAGIDVGPHSVRVLLADLAGTVLAARQAAAPPRVTGPELAELVLTTLTATAGAAGVEPTALWAVGAGTPGIVDRERGEVVLAPSIPGWAGLPTLSGLGARLGCPVLLDNDVNLAVLAERWRGESSDNLVFVQWGERIGSGIVIGGKPYRGASAAAGELGFIDLVTPVDERPDPPADGLGAFERLVGARAIHALAEPLGLDLADGLAPLFAAAESGDPAALRVVDTVAARFARGLATQLLILDPDRVVIGGGLSRAGDILFDAVRAKLRDLVLAPVDLRVSSLEDTGVALGAVRMALDSAENRLLALV